MADSNNVHQIRESLTASGSPITKGAQPMNSSPPPPPTTPPAGGSGSARAR
jgi:hypothetical protein